MIIGNVEQCEDECENGPILQNFVSETQAQPKKIMCRFGRI